MRSMEILQYGGNPCRIPNDEAGSSKISQDSELDHTGLRCRPIKQQKNARRFKTRAEYISY